MLTRLHEGLDYLIYRIYIWGGLAGIVIYSIVASIIGLPRTGNTGLIILSLPVTVWFMGILAYWWWVFLFKDKKELKRSLENPPDFTPEINKLRNWTTLHTAMALSGGNADDILEYEKAARRPVIIWYGMQNLLAFWVLGNFWIWTIFQEQLPVNYIQKIWVPGVIVILILFLVLTPILVFGARKGGVAAYLTPLGLSMTEPPLTKPDISGLTGHDPAGISEGTMVLTGSRLGRRIYIEAMGKQSITWVESDTPAFEIHSQSGKLVAEENTPDAIQKALKELRQAKRWKGITVTGYSNGIKIKRESRGQNMWLYDLWLTERLLENLKA